MGNQIAGTSSRRASSASTQASIRSVLQASGARPFTFCASAISTCHPASSSRSCTKRGQRAVHRLDRGANRRAVSSETFGQSIQAVFIRRRSTNLDRPAVPVK
jgi:hypothetical protein